MMREARVRVRIGKPREDRWIEAEARLDKCSWCTVIPERLSKELGLKPLAFRNIVLPDGSGRRLPVTLSQVNLLGRETVAMASITPGEEILIGSAVLEDLGLELDSKTGELRASKPAGLLRLSLR